MVFFITFILGAILLGAGAMLAPAWPTHQPRIGLAAALSLALVVGGAVWWAAAFGWSTLVIDYLLFALVSIVVLGGTMAQAQERAEEAGEELADEDVGWPGPEDLAFFTLAALLSIAPLLLFNLPYGNHAPAQATLSVIAREGSSAFPPFASGDVALIAPPGLHALSAYLSHSLRQAVPLIQMAIGSVLALLTVWVAYDLGSEIRNKRLGRAFAIAVMVTGGTGYFLLFSNYSQLAGLVFGLAFITYALRYTRHHQWWDMIGAGLLLGAVLYVSPSMFLLLLAGYYGLLLVGVLPRGETMQEQIGTWLGVLAVMLFGVAPYLLRIFSSLGNPDVRGVLLRAEQQPIIALAVLLAIIIVGYGLHFVFKRLPQGWRSATRTQFYPLMLVALLVVIGGLWLVNGWLDDPINEGDYAALIWLRENADDAAIIHDAGAGWAQPFTGNLNVMSPLPEYAITDVSSAVFDERTFGFRLLNSPENRLPELQQRGITHLFVPSAQSFTAPEYLELIFEQDGARVYRVVE